MFHLINKYTNFKPFKKQLVRSKGKLKIIPISIFVTIFSFVGFSLILVTVYSVKNLLQTNGSEPQGQSQNPESLLESFRKGPYESSRIPDSGNWSPLVISECVPGLPPQAAPCLKEHYGQRSNLVSAQEIIYPSFRLATPKWVNETLDKELWLTHASTIGRFRVSSDGKWADYPVIYGQNLVFQNSEYKGDPPPDVWSERASVEFRTSHKPFLHITDQEEGQKVQGQDYEKSNEFEILLIGTAPDSWSFQHFLDRVLLVFTQAKLCIPMEHINRVTLISGRTPQPIVNEMYSVLKITHVHFQWRQTQPRSADYIVFPGRTPLIHPYTTQGITNSFGFRAFEEPISKRKHVLYFSRGPSSFNPGRSILNEADLLDSIRELLQERRLGEELIIFEESKFKSFVEVGQYISSNALAIIGPHGGKFYNGRFAPPGTLVMEFVPSGRIEVLFWELSRLSEQNYFVHILESINKDHDMRIPNINQVISVLRENLGKEFERTEALMHSYSWDIEI